LKELAEQDGIKVVGRNTQSGITKEAVSNALNRIDELPIYKDLKETVSIEPLFNKMADHAVYTKDFKKYRIAKEYAVDNPAISEKMLSIDKIIPTEDFVNRKQIKDIIDNFDWNKISTTGGRKLPPRVVLYDGKYYINDGHHRLSALKLLNIKEVPVHVIDMDRLATIKATKKTAEFVPAKTIKEFEFTAVKDIEQLDLRFDAVGISNPINSARFGWHTDSKFLKSVGNPALEEIERIGAVHPGIISKLKKTKIRSIEFEYNKILSETDGGAGAYSRQNRKIRLALKNGMDKSKDSLEFGRFTVGGETDFKSNLRHEIGHHIYDNIYNSQKVDGSTFANIYNKLGGRRYFAENISEYAGESIGEAFAECFSAYTSPLYGVSGRKLPVEIEEFMEHLFLKGGIK
jgi:hypothetical protein